MDESTLRSSSELGESNEDAGRYQPPTVEVIALDCEISAYAPDDDDTPLF
jgi:hypothetical protein